MFDLKGIVPPVVTPVLEDESVDEAGLERLLEKVVSAGVHGLFFLGSTGEQPALRDAVRAQAITAATQIVAGRAPLIVGTMASSTARAIDNIRQAELAGADAVAVAPPHYYPSRGEAEQIAHYRACAAATGLPVIIYNIPSTTKVMMAPDTMARIAELPNVVGAKDSSGDFIHFQRVLERFRALGKAALVGTPPLAAPAVLAGGQGAVPGISNIDPFLMLDVYDAALRRDLEALPPLQARVHRLMDLVTHGAPIVCIKTALELLGICSARACAPLQPLSPEKREVIASILRELELL